jgi:hypothetical protein
MKFLALILLMIAIPGCRLPESNMKKILFLHHSTGYNVWLGNTNKYIYKLTGKSDVKNYIQNYNRKNKTSYLISEQFFPKSSPYGWNNYPYDYYNIWVKNSGKNPYMEEPTLEMLTKKYDLIIFKHCFPVSRILPDAGMADIDSDLKTIENYKLQYEALRCKMNEFPQTKFIIWTPAVNTQKLMSEAEAIRTRQFHDWIINEWDQKGDNVFVWDFYKYETEGGLYLSENNALSPDNSHPNKEFAAKVAPILSKYVIDVIENRVE